MNYQKTITQSYLVEGVSSIWAISGIGAMVYAIAEKDIDMMKVGVGNLVGGVAGVFMARSVREDAKDNQEMVSHPLEDTVNYSL